MASHRINLRGPWDYILKESAIHADVGRSTTGTATMPQEWRTLFGEIPGTARFRRKFHRPTNLESHEHTWLILTEVRGNGIVELNGLPIGQFAAHGEQVEFEISTLMKPFNEIVVNLTFDPQIDPLVPGGLFGVVALEIRSP